MPGEFIARQGLISRGNVVVTGSLTTSGSLTTTGTITATTLVVQTITSSISSVTGSTNFGSLVSNTHTFTGSLNVTGALAVTTNGVEFQVNSTGVNLGNALTDSHIISGSLRVNPNGLFVSGSGLVGIGTTVPSYTLDVSGSGRFNGNGVDIFTSSGVGSSGVTGLLRVVTAGTSTGIAIGQANSSRYTAIQPNEHIIYNDDFFMRTNGAFPLSLGTNNTIRLSITSAGNVGIGTSSPMPWGGSFLGLSVGQTSVGCLPNSANAYFTNNLYYDGSSWRRGIAAPVSILQMNENIITIQSAGTGTAGSVATMIERVRVTENGLVAIGGSNNTFIDYSSNVCRFYGGSGTNTFGLGAGSTIYYQGDNSQFYPTADNARSIGLGSNRYTAIWAVNGTIQTSDEREKTDIVDSDLGLDFVNKLRPVSYKWKVGQNIETTETTTDEEGNEIIKSIITPRAGIRTHYGLIAQEVEALLDGKDFGGFIHDKDSDVMGLRYEQFIPLLIKAIQEQNTLITDLRTEIEELKARI
jgi:hypothetical protein